MKILNSYSSKKNCCAGLQEYEKSLCEKERKGEENVKECMCNQAIYNYREQSDFYTILCLSICVCDRLSVIAT